MRDRPTSSCVRHRLHGFDLRHILQVRLQAGHNRRRQLGQVIRLPCLPSLQSGDSDRGQRGKLKAELQSGLQRLCQNLQCIMTFKSPLSPTLALVAAANGLHTSDIGSEQSAWVQKRSPQGAIMRVEHSAEAPAWRSAIRLCGAGWPRQDPAGTPRIYPGTACPEQQAAVAAVWR